MRFLYFFLLLSVPLVSAQPGTLDPSFGTTGLTILSAGNAQSATAAASLPDGRTVIGGALDGLPALLRLTADGLLDTTFGTDGYAIVNTMPGSEISAISLQADGRIAALINVLEGSSEGSLIAMLTADGSPDLSFGINGQASLPTAYPYSGLDTDAFGRLYTTSRDARAEPADSTQAVVRLLPAGDLDLAYATDGFAAVAFPNETSEVLPRALVLLPDGSVVTTGLLAKQTSPAYLPYVARLTPTGQTDVTFGSSGIVLFDDREGRGFNRIEIDRQGRVVAVGYAEDQVTFETVAAVVRLLPSGVPDGAFGTGGWVETGFGEPFAFANDLLTEEDGGVLVAGIYGDGITFLGPLLARLLPDGSLDPTFGTGGTATIPTPSGGTILAGSAIDRQADGRLILAGSVFGLAGTPVGVFAARFAGTSVAAEPTPATGLTLAHAGAHPAVGTASVEFALEAAQTVRLDVIDATGRLAAVLHDGALAAGRYTFTLDHGLAAGIYTFRALAGPRATLLRVVVL